MRRLCFFCYVSCPLQVFAGALLSISKQNPQVATVQKIAGMSVLQAPSSLDVTFLFARQSACEPQNDLDALPAQNDPEDQKLPLSGTFLALD